MLLAEGDRDAYRREQAALAREREIMKDVKGWEVRRVLEINMLQNLIVVLRLERVLITGTDHRTKRSLWYKHLTTIHADTRIRPPCVSSPEL